MSESKFQVGDVVKVRYHNEDFGEFEASGVVVEALSGKRVFEILIVTVELITETGLMVGVWDRFHPGSSHLFDKNWLAHYE